MEGTVLTVLRDCDAMLIPNGVPVTLREGEQIMITQAIGGTYTVNVNGNLARVEAHQADALGLTEELIAMNSFVIPERLDDDSVWEVLATCFDPEIPVNIVELGLIYDMQIKPLDELKSDVMIQMTLTAAGCGMGPVLVEDVRARVGKLPGVNLVDVDLVFDPPWNQALMSEAAKLTLGML